MSNIPADVTLVSCSTVEQSRSRSNFVMPLVQSAPSSPFRSSQDQSMHFGTRASWDRGEDKEAILIYDRLSEVNNCVTYLDGVRIKDHFLSVCVDSWFSDGE